MKKTTKKKAPAAGLRQLADNPKSVGSSDLAAKDARTVYRSTVDLVATHLRPRFESGELRGFTDEDEERCGAQTLGRDTTYWIPPLWRVEAVCARLFIRSPEVALFVVRMASRSAWSASWDWARAGGNSLLGCAKARMAVDVLQFARARGWSKPTLSEEPAPRRTRSAA